MKLLLTLACSLLVSVPTVRPQDPGAAPRDPARDERPRGPLPVHEPPAEPGIAWFGTWEQALAEARRSGRPILFHSAAPQCQRVPGVW